jgi:capsular polysaccharide biosynthesis protein
MTTPDPETRGSGRFDEIDPAPMSNDTPDQIVLSETDVVPLGAPAPAPTPVVETPKPVVEPPKPAFEVPKPRPEPPKAPIQTPRPPVETRLPPRPQPPAPLVATPTTPEPANTEPRAAWRDPGQPNEVQVADYLMAIRRRMRWLVLIPLLVGIIAAGLLVRQPLRFRSRATVTIPITASLDKGPSSSEVSQAVSDFQQVIVSDAVLTKVSKDTGVSKADIREHLAARRLGTSSLVNVTYTNIKRAKASEVVEQAARTGVQRLFEPAVIAGTIAVETAERELNSVQTQVANFNTSHSLATSPQEAYRQKQLQLAQTPAGSAAAKTLQAEAASLASLAAEFQRLQARVGPLTAVANAAGERQADARARLEASKAPSTVDVVSTRRVPRLRPLATGVATAVGAAALLVLALIIVLELFDPTHRALPRASRPAAAPPQQQAQRQAASSRRRGTRRKKSR